jgi:6-phosphogluconolactonase
MKLRSEVEYELCDAIVDALEHDIAKRGKASLLVSGGSTPIALFRQLRTMDLDWSRVMISLVDERFVADDHTDQNGAMVRRELLQEDAAAATFFPLVLDASNADRNLGLVQAALAEFPRPFSVVILGMGGDGHTASLFPESPQLDEGMRLDQSADLMMTDPMTAPHRRITFTRRALLQTRRLMLHCYGKDKRAVLDSARILTTYRPYPIEGFLHQDMVGLEVYWTE